MGISEALDELDEAEGGLLLGEAEENVNEDG